MLIKGSDDDPKLLARVKKIVNTLGSGNAAAKLFEIARPSVVQYIADRPVFSGTVELFRTRVDAVEKEAAKIVEAREERKKEKFFAKRANRAKKANGASP